MTRQTTRPVLVTGATGMTGSRVLAQLRERGVAVRAASRSSEWRFDWTDPATWDRVLDGAGAVYLVQNDTDPRTPAFVERAVALGVERIVQLSARGVDVPGYYGDRADAIAHLQGEEAVKASGLEWTVLRPGWFAHNFNEGLLADGVRTGTLRLPTGNGAASWIDAEDIAAVAVAALTEPGHNGHTYVLSGARLLTLSEVAAEITAALERTVRYEPVSVEEYVADLVGQGWPEREAREMAMVLSPITRGSEAELTTGVQDALGREPRSFDEFVRDAVASGGWT